MNDNICNDLQQFFTNCHKLQRISKIATIAKNNNQLQKNVHELQQIKTNCNEFNKTVTNNNA